ncbi:MAG: hypothetical protein GX066_04020 [Clostridiaceae bacterium]|nr:hypothetical protein [Clostridiaceae bacterium]
MTADEIKNFENFLSKSFEDGVCYRELRLSDDEVKYIKDRYPRISLVKDTSGEESDGKAWFQVRLPLFSIV